MDSPAIIITAFNRPASLSRLLNSLAKAHFPSSNIALVISIDQSQTKEVAEIARDFEWKFGEKSVLEHDQHLGLKQHILECGKLIRKFGSAIFLEDDLLVSPHFYSFASNAIKYYQDESQIAGVSLYNYQFSENGYFPFQAISDQSDVYFMQLPSSWGQAWTDRQWSSFAEWIDQHGAHQSLGLPAFVQAWSDQSWKKLFVSYLMATDRFFVFPRTSFSTNYEDPGTHATTTGLFQVPLQLSESQQNFERPENSLAVYDAWFELLPRCLKAKQPDLDPLEFDVDLHGTKAVSDYKYPLVLTTKEGPSEHEGFGTELFPLEQNIILGTEGHGIRLVAKDELGRAPDQQNFYRIRPIAREIFPSEKKCTVALIIPATADEASQLENTLVSLEQQAGLQVILVLSSHEKELLLPQLPAIPYPMQWEEVDNDLDQWQRIAAGLKVATAEIVGWMRPGSTLEVGAIKEVQALFDDHGTINWVVPLGDEPFVPLRNRMNSYLAKRQLEIDGIEFTTEGMFWRSIHSEIASFGSAGTGQDAELAWFVDNLKQTKLHPVLRKWIQPLPGTSTRMVGNVQMVVATPSLTWRLLTSLLFAMEGSIHTHYLHDLFGLLYDLPGVLRLDAEHGSFRLERY